MTLTYIAPVVIDRQTFHEKLKGNLAEFARELEEARKALKNVSGHKSDNSFFRFTDYYGREFTFLITVDTAFDKIARKWHATGAYHLTVWSTPSDVELFCETLHDFDTHAFRVKVSSKVFFVADSWIRGLVRCSDCGEWMRYRDNSHYRYFAGVYCPDCWDKKWKAIEAKETYE